MFKTRLLSGIVLVILALFLIISGHEILLFATLAKRVYCTHTCDNNSSHLNTP